MRPAPLASNAAAAQVPGSGTAVMVKVLPFHDELPMPPLVNASVGEGEEGGVEPRIKTRQTPGDEAQTMRFAHPCALTALKVADKVPP